MLLVVDVGNTHITLGVFDGDSAIHVNDVMLAIYAFGNRKSSTFRALMQK